MKEKELDRLIEKGIGEYRLNANLTESIMLDIENHEKRKYRIICYLEITLSILTFALSVISLIILQNILEPYKIALQIYRIDSDIIRWPLYGFFLFISLAAIWVIYFTGKILREYQYRN